MKSPKSLFAACVAVASLAGIHLNAWYTEEIVPIPAGNRETRYTRYCGQGPTTPTWSGTFTTGDPDLASYFPGMFKGTLSWPFAYIVYVAGLDGSPHTGIGGGSITSGYYFKFTKNEIRRHTWSLNSAGESVYEGYTVIGKTYDFSNSSLPSTSTACKPGE